MQHATFLTSPNSLTVKRHQKSLFHSSNNHLVLSLIPAQWLGIHAAYSRISSLMPSASLSVWYHLHRLNELFHKRGKREKNTKRRFQEPLSQMRHAMPCIPILPINASERKKNFCARRNHQQLVNYTSHRILSDVKARSINQCD